MALTAWSRSGRIALLVGVALAAMVVVVALPTSHPRRPGRTAMVTGRASPSTGPTTPVTAVARPAPTTPPTTAPAGPAPTTAPTSAPATSSTTVDPGTLPQTTALPSPTDPTFRARLAAMWTAVTTGRPALGLPAFFPLSAYIQVKAISDPVHDYDTRLIADYDQDIESLHARLGGTAASAVLTGITVPSTAQWILPGVEYNKGSYWRVYDAVVSYTAGGQAGTFTIASMISWRGQWYVVHLLSIR